MMLTRAVWVAMRRLSVLACSDMKGFLPEGSEIDEGVGELARVVADLGAAREEWSLHRTAACRLERLRRQRDGVSPLEAIPVEQIPGDRLRVEEHVVNADP